MNWHLQILWNEWVLWGYGPPGGVTHISPASVTVYFDLPPYTIDFPFELPDPPGLPPPQEYDRVPAWGWRFETNDFAHDTGWRLARTEEEAVEAATHWVEEQHPRDREPFAYALLDIRIEHERAARKRWRPSR